jgi:hypothetical protein
MMITGMAIFSVLLSLGRFACLFASPVFLLVLEFLGFFDNEYHITACRSFVYRRISLL